MKLLKNFLCFIVTISFIINISNAANQENQALRFLQNFQDYVLIFEFPFSCGNGYLTMKRICADIGNELIRRNIPIPQKLESKNIASGNANKDKDSFFNIFLEKNTSDKVLIATTNPNSKNYLENLNDYPQKLFSDIALPTDDDFTFKFNLIKVIQQRIIDNI